MDNNVTKIFSKRLKNLISESGKSIKQLSEILGIPSGSLSKYQNDGAEPGINNLYKMCDHFNVSADFMLGLSDVKSVDTDYKVINKILPLDELSIINLTLLKASDEVFINDKYFYIENDKTLHFKPSLILNSFISNSSFTIFLHDFLLFIGSQVLLVEYSKWAKELTFDLVRNDDVITKTLLGGYKVEKYSDEILNAAAENLYSIIDRELFEDRSKFNDIDYLIYKFDKEVKLVTENVYSELSEKAKNTLWISSDLDNLKAAFKEKLENITKTLHDELGKANM
ncbi:helix-turn-helix domain-containing protein [Acetobacterium sp.]|uniref:helix-turn-helix domain-containing protein n=1 Tax=Acetobacterium sp. TaxID=1872094 RepID=UPI003593D6A5